MSKTAVRIYNHLDELDLLDQQRLSRAQGQSSFFFHLAWFRNLYEAGWDRSRALLRLYSLEEESEGVQVMLPMVYNKPAHPFGMRELGGLSNYYSSLFGPIATRALTPTDWEAIALAMAKDRIPWDRLDLHPMDRDHFSFSKIQQALEHLGIATQPYFCFANWYLKVASRSYAQYFDSLPSSLRNTIRRKFAQLNKANRLSFKVFRDTQEIEEGIEAFQQVYASSWKSAEPHPLFIPSLIALCARERWLRLGIAYVDGKAAAAQIWIVHSGTAHIYKLAYDEQFASLSIGSLLTAHLMQYVIDTDQVREVDYLTGDEPYKQDWMSDRRERWGLVAYNLSTCRGRAAYLINAAKQAIKPWLAKGRVYALRGSKNPQVSF